ncbi:MAG TPA: Crp/Fnr family transcriptional regulator [Atribacterota bacterium]|nr:Crp/Fnr family transcriptional regulator [Atribacterota bacterium]
MEELSDFLKQCILFKDMNYVDIDNFLKVSNFTIKKYLKGNLVVLEDSTCEELGILRKGLLEVQSLYPSGKSLTLNRLESAEIFGEIILFSKSNKFPSTIKAIEDSEIMFIKKANLMNCLSNCHRFMENFLTLLSDRLFMLNKKIKMLTMENIRQKIGDFLSEEYKKQKTLIIKVPLSRQEMAEHMGIQRPSLSRELSKMRKEGIIEFDKEFIVIKDLDDLNNL